MTVGVLLAVAATVAGAASVAGHAVVIDATGNLANQTTGLTAALQGLYGDRRPGQPGWSG